MIINPATIKFDSKAYSLYRTRPQLRYAPFNTSNNSLRIDEKQVKQFFSDFFLEFRGESDMNKKIDLVDTIIGNFCNKFRNQNPYIKYSQAEEEFQIDRWHEISDNFLSRLKLKGVLACLGEIKMTSKEYDSEVISTSQNILNSIRRYEFLRKKGIDGSLIKPKQVFDMALNFGADFSKNRGVKFKTKGTNILDSYENGIFLRSKYGVKRVNDSKLLTVVSNLVQNAGKYTKDNSTVEIGISKLEENGKTFLTLSIKDEGIGFPKDIIENLSTERAQNAIDSYMPGKGHGLQRVKKIIDAVDAKLEINSPLHPSIKDFPGSEVKITAEVLNG